MRKLFVVHTAWDHSKWFVIQQSEVDEMFHSLSHMEGKEDESGGTVKGSAGPDRSACRQPSHSS
jgi:hypothetical protein